MNTSMGARLLHWSLDRAAADGLAEVAAGDVVEIDGSGRALVTALWRDHAELAPLDARPPAPNAQVRRAGPLTVPTGETLIGRIVDCLGRPLDGEPATTPAMPHRVFFPAAPPFLAPTRKRLTMGLLVYDLQHVFPAGISLLAKGRTQVARHILRHLVSEGYVCIYAR